MLSPTWCDCDNRHMRHSGVTGFIVAGLLLYGAGMAQAEEPVSGYEFLSPEIQAMQDDEVENPGMLVVEQGKVLFHTPGDNGKSCASCHGENGSRLDTRRVAQYPVYNQELEGPVSLQQQIHLCWEDHEDNFPLPYNCPEAVSLETYVKYLSRGEVINVDTGGPMTPYYEAGRRLYNTRFGQLDMACAHCHELYQGRMLRGQVLNQGHTNGFPEYRLGSGQLTTLHKRLKECFYSFRAEPFESGSQEYINLEIYLNARGNGLRIETPAVRY